MSVEFDVDKCKMATGEIPAPGVFHGDKSKDKKTFRQWKKKCERWFIAKEISSEKKKVQWIECLLEDNADDVYEMIPVDGEKGFRPPRNDLEFARAKI